jgi:hypothetical protein
LSGERLPTQHGDVAIDWRYFHCQACPAILLRANELCTAATERLIDYVVRITERGQHLGDQINREDGGMCRFNSPRFVSHDTDHTIGYLVRLKASKRRIEVPFDPVACLTLPSSVRDCYACWQLRLGFMGVHRHAIKVKYILVCGCQAPSI